MNRRNLGVLVALAVIVGMLASGCAPAQKPTPIPSAPQVPAEVRIGWLDALTGAAAAGGEMEWKAAQLANKQRGTVLDKPVKLILVDDKTDKTEAAQGAARLVDVEKVNFVIGSWWSSLALAASEVTEKAGIPFLTPTCTNPMITNGRPYNFRLNFIDSYQGYAIARYAVQTLKAKRAAVLLDVQQDFSTALAKYIRDAFIQLTGDQKSVVAFLSLQTGDKDFTAQLTQIKSLNPDVVFVPIYHVETALVLKQAAAMGMKIPNPAFIGSTGCDAPELTQLVGAEGDGFLFSTSYEPAAFTSPVATKFKADFNAAYGIDPDYSAVCSYDAYNLVLDSMQKAGGVDGKAVSAVLAATKNWEGASGVITFDAKHDPAKSVVFVRLQGGKRVVDSVVQPE